MKPSVVAKLGARGQIGFEPVVRRGVDQMLDRENGGIDLIARLQRVAAVHE
jgi:hypothetical protein